MSKEVFYFSHDYEPTSDPKIQALLGEFGGEGYGVYWRIVEMLHSDSCHKLPFKKYLFLAIAKQMKASVEQIEAIIKQSIDVFELFSSDDVFFWSNRVIRNFELRAQLSEKRSIAGKAGAIAKQNQAKSSKGKERKGNKENINILFSMFWDLYDKKLGDRLKCEKKWVALSDDDRQKIIDTIPGFKATIRDKQYLPYPETYLNQKRWNDEIEKNPAINKVPEEAYDRVGWGRKIEADAIGK